MVRSLILTTALLTAGALNAQDYNVAAPTAAEHKKETSRIDLSPDERANKEAERMAQKLKLDAEQKEKWRAAALERQLANQPYKEKLKGATTPEERHDLRKKVRANHEVFDKTVSEFLTADQKRKLEEQRTARRDRGKEHRKNARN